MQSCASAGSASSQGLWPLPPVCTLGVEDESAEVSSELHDGFRVELLERMDHRTLSADEAREAFVAMAGLCTSLALLVEPNADYGVPPIVVDTLGRDERQRRETVRSCREVVLDRLVGLIGQVQTHRVDAVFIYPGSS